MSYGELTAIRVWGTGVDRSYGIDRSRAVDPGELLSRFAGYAPTHADWWTTRHTEIAERLDGPGSNAESVIIISELLDERHYDDERYVVLSERDIVSEVRETVFRHFERELNDEMAAWLEHHDDPDDVHLEKLLRAYEQRALPILEDQYAEFEMEFDREAAFKPRRETLRERRYDLPSPFDHWDSRNSYQQYFFLKNSRTYAQSGGGSSGQRGNHSVFGLGFALHDRVRPVPTHILVHDRDNRLIEIDTLDRLCLVALDLGSNYDLPHAEVDATVGHALRCRWTTRDWFSARNPLDEDADDTSSGPSE